jgi:hypothetical protein
MGQAQSQKLTEEEKAKQDAENFVNDTRFISWDEKGNLRYGLVHPVKRLQQKLEILQLDFVDDEDGKLWYIMDSAWIASWLAYVHFDMQVAPAPGPCLNHRLITYDYADKKYVFRFALQMAVQDRGGDYRRVSPEVWAKFKEFYPSSGPAITMVFNAKEKRNDGFYDPAMFTIVDHVEPPADANDEAKTNKKKKRKLFAFRKKQEAEEKEKKEKLEKQKSRFVFSSSSKRKLQTDEAEPSSPSLADSAVATDPVRMSSRAQDSDDDSDADEASPNGGLLAKQRLLTRDSDDDSIGEEQTQGSLATLLQGGNNNNNNNNNNNTNYNKGLTTGTKVVLKSSVVPSNGTNGNNRLTELATSAGDTKDDAYYEKIYLS